MKNHWKSIALLCFCMIGLAGWGGGVWTNDWNGVKIGKGDTGQKFNLLDLHNVDFTDDTSATAVTDLPTDATYYVVASWKSSSADPGKVTTAISAGTLTVTTANATTGTCSVAVFGAP